MTIVRIIDTEQEHISQIEDIANSYLLTELPVGSSLNRGFLISGFTWNDYLNFLEYAEYYYVAVRENKVLGFLLGYSSDKIKEDECVNMLIKNYHRNPFIIVKQICVIKEMTEARVGTALYTHLFKSIPLVSVFAAIVTDPSNEASIKFHSKLGFIEAFSTTPPDGIQRSVWCWNSKQHRSN